MNSSTTSSEASRRYLAGFCASLVVCLGLIGPLLVFAIDPYQKFRRAWYAPDFGTNERYVLPGMARHYDYDTVVIGTSLAQNFYPSAVRNTLGGRPIKLAMSGSTSREQAMLLDVALATGRPRRIIWVVDHFLFRGPPGRVRDETVPFPYFLYDAGPWAAFRYLVNGPIQRVALARLLQPLQLRFAANDAVPDGWNAFDGYTRFGRDRLMESYRRSLASHSFDAIGTDPDYSLHTMLRSFETDMLSRIRTHPEVEFTVLFPPYSIRLADAYLRTAPAAFDRAIEADTEIARRLVVLPNVQIFDFRAADIVENENGYSDLWHFDRGGNEYVLQSIATGRHRLFSAGDVAADAAWLKSRASRLPPP